MKKVKGCKLVSLLAIGAIASSNVALPSAMALETAPTSPKTEESLQLAQIGQCRAAKRPIFIYAERSTTSRRVRALAVNEQVTLADNGANGWIAVNAPTTGFVQAADLKSCSSQQPSPPPSNLCRQLKVELNVRDNPNLNARVLRLLRAGQQVTLRTGQEVTAADGRVWVEISSPVAGWISTRPGPGPSNLADCSGSSAPPPPSPKTCQVIIPQGLRIWNSPTGSSIGGLALNQALTLTGQRRVIGDRVWVEISSPTRAWISSGFVGNENNISCR